MKELICKHLGKAVAFGIIMTVIGFFGGNTVFTFPPVWLDCLRLFLIHSVTFLGVYTLSDWVREKLRKDKSNENSAP